MNEFLKSRIDRKLEGLPDERVYQVLDYLEFLESKYATERAVEPSAFQKLAETVEDTLRAGRLSASAIKGTMDAMSAAGRLMNGLAAAGKSVVDGVAKSGAPKASEPPPPAGEQRPPTGERKP